MISKREEMGGLFKREKGEKSFGLDQINDFEESGDVLAIQCSWLYLKLVELRITTNKKLTHVI